MAAADRDRQVNDARDDRRERRPLANQPLHLTAAGELDSSAAEVQALQSTWNRGGDFAPASPLVASVLRRSPGLNSMGGGEGCNEEAAMKFHALCLLILLSSSPATRAQTTP